MYIYEIEIFRIETCDIHVHALVIFGTVTYSTTRENNYDQEKLDWLQSLRQFFINVSYHIRVASLTLMDLFC